MEFLRCQTFIVFLSSTLRLTTFNLNAVPSACLPRPFRQLRKTCSLFFIAILINLTVSAGTGHAITPSFRSESTATTGLTTSITIPKPPQTLTGDIMIAVITILAPQIGLTVTAPAGWTRIRTDIETGELAQDLFYRFATATEPVDYTFTHNQSRETAGAIAAYWQVDPITPIDAHSGQYNTAPSPTAPSVTTTVNDTTLVAIFGMKEERTLNQPGNMIERWEAEGTNGNIGFDEQFTGAGATGARTSSTNESSTIGQLIALRPSSLVPPGSAGTLLFVTHNDGTFTAQELLHTAKMESWGYTILPIHESDTLANYDAAIAQADVAYISEEVLSSQHGTRLRNACIGVVNEETRLVDELGIASTGIADTTTDTYISNTPHYITQPFPSDLRTLFSEVQPLWSIRGVVAPDAVRLAYLQANPSDSSLTVIEIGGSLYDGGTAAGRRVELPWGESTMDFSSMTASGYQIMQRSIEWAMADNICVNLIKRAFLTDGTPVTDGASLPVGTKIHFLLYIDNDTGGPINDLNVSDLLDPSFQYTPVAGGGTLKIDNSTDTGATEAAIYSAVSGSANLTEDLVNGSLVAGYTPGTTTISAGADAGNSTLNIAASKVWAILFEVTLQP